MTPESSKNGQHKEHHELQCRGLWIPIEIMEQFTSERITASELLLLAFMDSLVKAKGEGCWASKAYLAEKMGRTEEWARQAVARFIKLGLVKRVGEKKVVNKVMPVYETAWSRVKFTPLGTLPPTPLENLQDPPRKLGVNNKDNKKETQLATPNGEDSRNGHLTDIAWGFCQCMGDKVVETLKRKGYIRYGHIPSWGKSIKALLGRGYKEEEIETTIEWYAVHCGEDYVPIVYNSDQLLEKFNAIEGAMSKKVKDKIRDRKVEYRKAFGVG